MYNGTIYVCGHVVRYSYDVSRIRISVRMADAMDEHAERHAREMIARDCVGGDLNLAFEGRYILAGSWWVEGKKEEFAA